MSSLCKKTAKKQIRTNKREKTVKLDYTEQKWKVNETYKNIMKFKSKIENNKLYAYRTKMRKK